MAVAEKHVAAHTTLDVWEVFSQPLRSYILRRVSEPAAADDILQEVFLKIHQRLHTLRDEEKLPAWLYQIASHAIADHYRDRQGRHSLPGVITSDGGREELDAAAKLAAQMPYFVSACLPEKYGRALLLADLEGRSQQEVAAALGLSLSGAKSRVQRARRMLRAAFLKCCHFEFDGRRRVIAYAPRCGCACSCDEAGSSARAGGLSG
jgi:RNA polymerase sigma-70 factor (ECF subfamily)